MKVYLIRHGQSNDNYNGIHQDDNGNLSEYGINQSKYLRERFQNIEVDKIITSTSTRAIETTEIINSKKDLEIIYSDLFKEIRLPSVMVGKSKHDGEILAIESKLKTKYRSGNKKYDDEESFHEAKFRAKQALTFLKNLNCDTLIVVSHSKYIKLIISLMLFGNNVSGKDYMFLRNFLKLDNTGITLCEFSSGDFGWRLIFWNDRDFDPYSNSLNFAEAI